MVGGGARGMDIQTNMLQVLNATKLIFPAVLSLLTLFFKLTNV